MEAFALTDVGIERKINQDYVYFTLKQTGHLPNLFIVADGMGGHKAGDVASRYTSVKANASIVISILYIHLPI